MTFWHEIDFIRKRILENPYIDSFISTFYDNIHFDLESLLERIQDDNDLIPWLIFITFINYLRETPNGSWEKFSKKAELKPNAGTYLHKSSLAYQPLKEFQEALLQQEDLNYFRFKETSNLPYKYVGPCRRILGKWRIFLSNFNSLVKTEFKKIYQNNPIGSKDFYIDELDIELQIRCQYFLNDQSRLTTDFYRYEEYLKSLFHDADERTEIVESFVEIIYRCFNNSKLKEALLNFEKTQFKEQFEHLNREIFQENNIYTSNFFRNITGLLNYLKEINPLFSYQKYFTIGQFLSFVNKLLEANQRCEIRFFDTLLNKIRIKFYRKVKYGRYEIELYNESNQLAKTSSIYIIPEKTRSIIEKIISTLKERNNLKKLNDINIQTYSKILYFNQNKTDLNIQAPRKNIFFISEEKFNTKIDNQYANVINDVFYYNGTEFHFSFIQNIPLGVILGRYNDSKDFKIVRSGVEVKKKFMINLEKNSVNLELSIEGYNIADLSLTFDNELIQTIKFTTRQLIMKNIDFLKECREMGGLFNISLRKNNNSQEVDIFKKRDGIIFDDYGLVNKSQQWIRGQRLLILVKNDLDTLIKDANGNDLIKNFKIEQLRDYNILSTSLFDPENEIFDYPIKIDFSVEHYELVLIKKFDFAIRNLNDSFPIYNEAQKKVGDLSIIKDISDIIVLFQLNNEMSKETYDNNKMDVLVYPSINLNQDIDYKFINLFLLQIDRFLIEIYGDQEERALIRKELTREDSEGVFKISLNSISVSIDLTDLNKRLKQGKYVCKLFLYIQDRQIWKISTTLFIIPPLRILDLPFFVGFDKDEIPVDLRINCKIFNFLIDGEKIKRDRVEKVNDFYFNFKSELIPNYQIAFRLNPRIFNFQITYKQNNDLETIFETILNYFKSNISIFPDIQDYYYKTRLKINKIKGDYLKILERLPNITNDLPIFKYFLILYKYVAAIKEFIKLVNNEREISSDLINKYLKAITKKSCLNIDKNFPDLALKFKKVFLKEKIQIITVVGDRKRSIPLEDFKNTDILNNLLFKDLQTSKSIEIYAMLNYGLKSKIIKITNRNIPEISDPLFKMGFSEDFFHFRIKNKYPMNYIIEIESEQGKISSINPSKIFIAPYKSKIYKIQLESPFDNNPSEVVSDNLKYKIEEEIKFIDSLYLVNEKKEPLSGNIGDYEIKGFPSFSEILTELDKHNNKENLIISSSFFLKTLKIYQEHDFIDFKFKNNLDNIKIISNFYSKIVFCLDYSIWKNLRQDIHKIFINSKIAPEKLIIITTNDLFKTIIDGGGE